MARLSEQELVNLTRQEMAWYAGFSDDAKAYFIQDNHQQIYAVNGVRDIPEPKRGFIIVQARVTGEQIIIDVDSVWDKNLWKALVNAGVPREQIVLAYAGESLPEPS
jgi:hypothetical protein